MGSVVIKITDEKLFNKVQDLKSVYISREQREKIPRSHGYTTDPVYEISFTFGDSKHLIEVKADNPVYRNYVVPFSEFGFEIVYRVKREISLLNLAALSSKEKAESDDEESLPPEELKAIMKHYEEGFKGGKTLIDIYNGFFRNLHDNIPPMPKLVKSKQIKGRVLSTLGDLEALMNKREENAYIIYIELNKASKCLVLLDESLVKAVKKAKEMHPGYNILEARLVPYDSY